MKNYDYLYSCEGQQEEMYIEHFAKLIHLERPDVTIKFNKLKNIDRVEKQFTMREKIAFYDYDSNIIEFEKRVNMCNKTTLYYSSLNFDLWLLLHKQKYSRCETKNDAYVPLIRSAYLLSPTENIKNESTIKKILSQITLEDIKFAIKNCEEIMNQKLDQDKICINSKFFYYNNPSLNIHTFFKKIMDELSLL